MYGGGIAIFANLNVKIEAMKVMKYCFAAVAVLVMLVSCDQIIGGDGKLIIDPVEDALLEQTVGSTALAAEGVTFTTTGAWTSQVVPATKGSEPMWVSISPDHGDEAGTYTITISLEANDTGEDRKADIIITCGGQKITISITQVATEDVPSGDEPGTSTVNPLPNVDPADRIVARQVYGVTEFFEYNSKGQVSKITAYDPYEDIGELEVETTTYSYEGLLVKSSTSVVVYRKIERNGAYDGLVESVGEGGYVKEDVPTDAKKTDGVLNGAGRLATNKKYRVEHDWFHDVYSDVLTREISYTYSSDGNLAGVIENRVEDGWQSSYSVSWKNGNMEWIDYGDDERYTLTYREEEYKWPGINLYWDFDLEDFYGDMDVTGLDGKKFRNLLDRASAVNPETGEEVYCEMVYTFDAKNRVKTMHYRFSDSDGVYEDEDDAVVFYYGDETLPEVSVPVYLVRQEPVKAELKPHQIDENTFSGVSNSFDLWKWVKNVFSDGSETTYKYVTHSWLWMYASDEMPFVKEITSEELSQIRSMDDPVIHLSLSQQDNPERYYATYTADVPVIGEMSWDVMFGDYQNPQSVSLYNPEQNSSGMYEHYFDVFTHQYLSSLFRWEWTLDKASEGEYTDGTKVEYWNFNFKVKYNLWTDVLPGCEDTVTEANVQLWVPETE